MAGRLVRDRMLMDRMGKSAWGGVGGSGTWLAGGKEELVLLVSTKSADDLSAAVQLRYESCAD